MRHQFQIWLFTGDPLFLVDIIHEKLGKHLKILLVINVSHVDMLFYVGFFVRNLEVHLLLALLEVLLEYLALGCFLHVIRNYAYIINLMI